MTYSKILNLLRTKIVTGPHLAMGLRKPGESQGVWLFGELHEKLLPDNLPRSLSIIDLLQKGDIDTTILLFEGIWPPGKPTFKDAPDEVKTMVRNLIPDHELLVSIGVDEKTEEDEDDDDDDDDETEKDLDHHKVPMLSQMPYTSDELLEMGYNLDPTSLDDEFEDDGFLEFMIETSGLMQVCGNLYSSRGGLAINIDSKIRMYFGDALKEFEKRDYIDVDSLFTSIGWALRASVPPATRVLPGNSGIETLGRESARVFLENILQFMNNKREGLFPSSLLGEIVEEFLALLNEDVIHGKPYMLLSVEENSLDLKMRFFTLLVFVLMDMNIVSRMRDHPGKDFVSYCGVAHTLNQYLVLKSQGYVLEHTFFNKTGDFITPRSRMRNPKVNEKTSLTEQINFLTILFAR